MGVGGGHCRTKRCRKLLLLLRAANRLEDPSVQTRIAWHDRIPCVIRYLPRHHATSSYHVIMPRQHATSA